MRPPVGARFGTLLALAVMTAASAMLLPRRGHFDTATVGLMLVVPVVVAVIAGGFLALLLFVWVTSR